MKRPLARSWIGRGFLIGLGMVVPLAMAALLNEVMSMAMFELSFKERIYRAVRDASGNLHPIGDLRVLPFERVKHGDGETTLRGAIENTGDRTIATFEVEVEFFDQEAKFLGECTKSFRTQLVPKHVENVLVTCGGRFDGPIPEHVSFKVRAIQATSL
ncbi:hypothetical protein HLB44_07890 [Aquincola sp. S2]|uniref:DUF3426 domain-containing protein n=1 Tax=Pseudaquabacterium terrae TaxID=2732868 RepID=A0ABX2EE55_9BURK|nr:FxLYD domain-containing protein [Aquabacterium terrae]NRF66900.1 hypothetical protein [Aquabacterium terrae]